MLDGLEAGEVSVLNHQQDGHPVRSILLHTLHDPIPYEGALKPEGGQLEYDPERDKSNEVRAII